MRDNGRGAGVIWLLTVTETTPQPDISRGAIGRWITQARLPAALVNRRRRIHPAKNLAAVQAVGHTGALLPAWWHDPGRSGTRLGAVVGTLLTGPWRRG